jgi:pimeloyl-ACP methyl ester carboxylesterase
MGGWWVTETAVRFPDRAQSLILTGTIGGLYTPELETAFQSYIASARDIASTRPPEGRVGLHLALHQRVFERDPALAFLFQQLGTFYDGPGVEIAASMVRDRRTHAEVDETGVPVLMLAGSDDPVFPAPLLQKSAALLAHGEYAEIAHGGHVPFFTQAADWNAAVLGFLQRVTRAD